MGLMVGMVGRLEASGREKIERVEFSKGASHRTMKGAVKGKGVVDYRLTAKEGQEMEVNLKCEKGRVYFNVLPPGSEEAIFRGAEVGGHYQGVLPKSGTYTIRVYQMGAAADEGKEHGYSIEFGVVGKAKETKKESVEAGRGHEFAIRQLAGHTLKFKDHSGQHEIEFLEGGEYRKVSESQNGKKKEEVRGKWGYERLKPDQARIRLDDAYELTIDFQSPLEGKGKWDGDVREYAMRFYRADGE